MKAPKQSTQQVYILQSVALYGPRIIKDYELGEAIPTGYHAESRVRTGLLVGGAVTFGALYMLSVLVGAAITDASKYGSNGDRGELLYVPALGPFLQMTKTDSSSGNVTFAIDGLGQAAGVAMMVYGVASPKTVLVRNDLADVRLMPLRMGQAGGGLGIVGSF